MSGAVAGGGPGAYYRGAPATGGYGGQANGGSGYGSGYNGMGGNRGGSARLSHSHSFSSATSPRPDAPLSSTNLYIRGLPPNTTDDELRRMCEEFGKITSTKAIMDKMTNTCKGYGFVDFESGEGASAAVDGLQARGIQAQMAKARTAMAHSGTGGSPFGVEQDPTNLYIANLPLTYNETQLENALTDYGMVISTRILRNGEGTSRGVGFARMDNREKCEEIIRALNGTVLPGSPEGSPPLLVKLADSGHSRKKRTPMGMMGMDGPMMGYGGHGFPSNDLYARGGGMNTLPYMMHPSFMMHGHHGYNSYAFDNLSNQMNALSMGGGARGGADGAGAGGQANGDSAAAAANGHPMYHQGNYGYPAANQYYSAGGMQSAEVASSAGSYAAAASNHYGGGAAANGGYGGHNGGAGDHEPIGTFQASTNGGANGRPKYGKQ